MEEKLREQLKEVGLKPETPPSSKDVLVSLLKQGAAFLSDLDQLSSASMMESM
uniref:Sister chromatid cohesion protein PDS5 homolog A isoform X1 n=1 Tax=Rhizophora mucronata TaxID=61149 RepID=A0A2P2PW81_RHIMU